MKSPLLYFKNLFIEAGKLSGCGVDASGLKSQVEGMFEKWKQDTESLPMTTDDVDSQLAMYAVLENGVWYPVKKAVENTQGGLAWSIYYKNGIENGTSRIGRWAFLDAGGDPCFELTLEQLLNTEDMYLR